MAGQLFYLILYSRNTCGTAYQQYLAKLGSCNACILQRCLNRSCGTLYQIVGQLVEFCSCQVHIEMLRSLSGCCDERKVDVGCGCAGKLLLRLLCGLFQSLHSHLVTGQVYALGALELCKHVIYNLLIEVVAAQTVVACGSQNLDNAVANLDDRYIEGTAAQVVYHDLLLFLIVQAVCQRCRGRLVDDTLYVQARNLTCVLGCLSLRVVEVCRYGNNCLGNLLAQIVLCVCFQLLQNHSGNLLRSVLLSVDVYFVIGTHLSLNRRNGFLGVGNCLTLCRLAYQSLACLCKCHYRRCGSCSLCICYYYGLSALHNCYAAVCCS